VLPKVSLRGNEMLKTNGLEEKYTETTIFLKLSTKKPPLPTK
jgi:hypothetical protein